MANVAITILGLHERANKSPLRGGNSRVMATRRLLNASRIPIFKSIRKMSAGPCDHSAVPDERFKDELLEIFKGD